MSETKDYADGWRPEKGLHEDARKMLEIVLDPGSDNQEAGMAATTLVEAVAPRILSAAVPDEKDEPEKSLKGLVAALNILLKYGNPTYPTHCEHDIMIICGIAPDDVSDEDKATLEKLGFFVSDEYGEDSFQSWRYGSA